MQWVGAQVQSRARCRFGPARPCRRRSSRSEKVTGVRLLDQGVDKQGQPVDGFTPGMDIHAALTVVGDGPVGPLAGNWTRSSVCRTAITPATGRWA